MRILDFNGTKVKWLGHDSFKFEFDGKILYIDPYEIKETDKADIILITHGHYDHCSIKDLMHLTKQDTLIVTTPDTTSKFSGKVHCGDLKLVKPGDKFNIGNISVEIVPAYNIDKEFHPKENEWVGYIFNINGIKFYHAGDTDLIPEMSSIQCDVALLPVSGTYVMNIEEALKAAKMLMPKIIIPMHYGKIIGEKDCGAKFKEACVSFRVEVLD